MVRMPAKRSRKNNSIDEPLLIAYLALLFIGLVMVYSTSSMWAASKFGSNFVFVKSQAVAAVISVLAIFVILKIDLKRIAVFSVPTLFVIIFMLALVFLMPARNGSQRWLMVGPLTVQPSELFKFVMILFLAFSLGNPKRDITDLKQLLFPYVPVLGLGILLILLEPDLGTAMVICATILGLFFLAGARLKHLAVAIIPTVSAAALMVFGLGYKKARIMNYIHSIIDPLEGSYQVKQAALTLGAGGFWGVGLGDGRQKLFFLPYPFTDFIFASIGEEVGMIGLMVILALFFFILWRGLKIASRQPDNFGYLLASGMTLSLFINVAINLGVVTAILPVTGLPLPFISSGGSSLLVSSASIGILLNLSKRMEAK